MTAASYDEGFYRGQRDASFAAAQKILPVVLSMIPSRSVLDVGCGVGPWVASSLELGVSDSLGIDGSYVDRSLLLIPQNHFQSYNLADGFDLRRKFDLLICMEVAEHISPSAADLFLDSLVRHGDAILFSAAIPGQGGTYHVNEQWPDYWQERFEKRGYRKFDVIRRRVWDDRQIPVWYRQNAYLYVSEAALPRYPALLAEPENCAPVAWVHPDFYISVLERPLSLRRIVKELPSALGATLRIRFFRLLGRKVT